MFVLLAEATESPLISLSPFYEWAARNGFTASAEHILIHGVPVQFLPVHNALAAEAVRSARTLDYDPEPAVPASLAASKTAWHRAQASLPIREKFRILLKLQAEDLPLIQQRRALQPWERPWAIKP